MEEYALESDHITGTVAMSEDLHRGIRVLNLERGGSALVAVAVRASHEAIDECLTEVLEDIEQRFAPAKPQALHVAGEKKRVVVATILEADVSISDDACADMLRYMMEAIGESELGSKIAVVHVEAIKPETGT